MNPPRINQNYLVRFRNGEWRAPIFRDMVLDQIRAMAPPKSLAILDIGCGRGFDDDVGLQESLAAEARLYIGVEPDTSITTSSIFSTVHHTFFEDAPIAEESIDIAFAVMVLEHLKEPHHFWNRLHKVLRTGGVFFGFTIDSRHWFSKASKLAGLVRVKDWYLNHLHGLKGEERYENYPVFYRSNAPQQISELTSQFAHADVVSFSRIGQMDYYLPPALRWLGQSLDRIELSAGRPGSVLVVRVEK